MKEKKTARMRDGNWNRKLKTIYFYDGWYAIRGGEVVHYCGDSDFIYDGGNLDNVPSDDIFTLARENVDCMRTLVKLVNEHCR